jgi:DNA-binding IclR family transcriptional regulator
VTGIAAPVFDRDRVVLGSLVLAYSSAHPPPISEDALAHIVTDTAKLITCNAALEDDAALKRSEAPE